MRSTAGSHILLYIMQCSAPANVGLRAPRMQRLRVTCKASVAVGAPVVVKAHGAATLKGTVRKINEDRYDVQVPSCSDVTI